jgi:hypothetical protein
MDDVMDIDVVEPSGSESANLHGRGTGLLYCVALYILMYQRNCHQGTSDWRHQVVVVETLACQPLCNMLELWTKEAWLRFWILHRASPFHTMVTGLPDLSSYASQHRKACTS